MNKEIICVQTRSKFEKQNGVAHFDENSNFRWQFCPYLRFDFDKLGVYGFILPSSAIIRKNVLILIILEKNMIDKCRKLFVELRGGVRGCQRKHIRYFFLIRFFAL